jgi:hypothetical protein
VKDLAAAVETARRPMSSFSLMQCKLARKGRGLPSIDEVMPTAVLTELVRSSMQAGFKDCRQRPPTKNSALASGCNVA